MRSIETRRPAFIVRTDNGCWWEKSKILGGKFAKVFLFSLISFVLSVNCSAQISTAGNDAIDTVFGRLAIKRVDHIGVDLVTFRILLNGREFDKLYGSTHIYYPDSGSSYKVNGRVLMEDFIGGVGDTPVITLYDLREKSPKILQITDKLDVDDVRWRPDGVLLEANNKWYVYRRGRLSKIGSISR